jgi:hypothetical protein
VLRRRQYFKPYSFDKRMTSEGWSGNDLEGRCEIIEELSLRILGATLANNEERMFRQRLESCTSQIQLYSLKYLSLWGLFHNFRKALLVNIINFEVRKKHAFVKSLLNILCARVTHTHTHTHTQTHTHTHTYIYIYERNFNYYILKPFKLQGHFSKSKLSLVPYCLFI